ncbi:PPE domain-containing protein [Saccharopolyspora sp. NPDC000359]|uniref:PPE domain-containing protein n=1 Tax=Saccharopolyspora sp. NPDC000359 TaxID=3154251 RepID=UPI0033317031
MGAFDWVFGKREVTGQAQMAFDHPKVYAEVEGGPGVEPLSAAASEWKEKVKSAFDDANSALERVLKDSEVLMQGGAADQARDAVTPLAQATQEAIEIAARGGDALDLQAQASADFKHAFPEPYPLPASNIGWADYVNPAAFAVKSGIRASHEDRHDEVEARARQLYEDYVRSSNERIDGMKPFPPPPTFTADVAPAETTPVGKVEPLSSKTGTGDAQAVPEVPRPVTPPPSVEPTPPPPVAPTPPGEQAPDAEVAPESPAESDSAWVAPAASGTPAVGGTAPAPTPGGAGGGVVGGVVMPPGGRSGATPPGVPGTGRGGGPGTGRSSPGTPGGGGRTGSGLGAPGQGSSSPPSPPGRGSTSGPGAAGAPAAGGRQKEEDKEHGRKFVKGGRDAWEDLEIPKVAPPVFGDWEAEALRGKPPRPPEER